MTEHPFKDYYGPDLIDILGRKILESHPTFPYQSFKKHITPQLGPLELKARVEVFADALKKFLPQNYRQSVKILIDILGPPFEGEEGMFDKGYHLYPVAQFIEKYGIDDFKISMLAIYEITKRFTSEFAIRPFIVKYPKETFSLLNIWSKDKNPHVRRLVSEGMRPRLPWAMKLDLFIKNPKPSLSILEKLKKDASKYVQKSVANHLNDIGKDHPDLILEVASRWYKEKHETTKWIVKHALRNFVKQGNPKALKILGFSNSVKVKLTLFQLTSKKIKIGSAFSFSFVLENLNKKKSKKIPLVIDYRIGFQTKSKKKSEKVFKLKNADLTGKLEIQKKHVFKHATTRTLYPGSHSIKILVNGNVMGEKKFELI